ncbi:MAG: ArsC family transcriptional regulator [Candidatus Kapabacteria bacterium]|nr:ArsC family transcriptional regulator [Candidatus Kapabacteria bacterium]
MNIQIFGTLKCKETNKAIRFFKERGIKLHFVDLTEKALSKGELENICRFISKEDLIDKECKEYEQAGLKFQIFDIADKLLNNSLLIKTPIVRINKVPFLGYQPEKWKTELLKNAVK